MSNNFEELLAKSLKESKNYKEKQDQRKSEIKLKEVTISEEERFLNSLSPEDRQIFENMLISDIGFVYYPGKYGKNSASSSFDIDNDRKYFQDKMFFLQYLREKELKESTSGRKAG